MQLWHFGAWFSGGLGTVELMVVLDVLEQQVSNLNDSMIPIKRGGNFFTKDITAKVNFFSYSIVTPRERLNVLHVIPWRYTKIPCHPENCILALKISVLTFFKIPPRTVEAMLHAYRKQGVALLSELFQNLDHENRDHFMFLNKSS